ncbi:signal transduction histidine kinase [Tamaricihabitans halophyticus]|uniref:histidine kinase n=1 Tax=Tamaricihabitans halophyticus TaxID=1262583 RepID=A0A4R2R159_9PSEU|nr:histidine kinase [Tamaricihabitans halophyticus]TCP56402.1 signal transduction histidine kinase [Tamaricihabitans halophyticus]
MQRLRLRRRTEAILICTVVLAFALLDIAISLADPTTGAAGPYAGLALLLSVDLAVLLIARAPLLVAGYVSVVSLAMLASDLVAPGLLTPEHQITATAVPTITGVITYNLAYTQPRRWAWPIIGLLALLASRPWTPSWDVLPFGLLNTAVPGLLAMYIEARQRLLRSLRDRAERAERERELQAEHARAEERTRLAAEMHDIVSHRLTLMVLQASALRVTSADEPTKEAAEQLRATGCQALEEMRDLVGVLRRGEAEQLPDAPMDVGELAELATESESVGIPVELTVTGDPAQASPVVARTAYRIVQEALTNVRKHAPGAQVWLAASYATGKVELSIRNSAPRRTPEQGLRESGSGAGLSGLRKRVELVRGTFHTESTSEGGFLVTATLPAYVPTAEVAG